MNEGQNISLECPYGQFTTPLFASYGTPAGNCNAGFAISSCHSALSTNVAENRCGRQSSCWGYIGSNYFGSPCPEEPKRWFAANPVCLYSAFNAPWIAQGINVASPDVYLPLNGCGLLALFVCTVYSLYNLCASTEILQTLLYVY